MKVLSYLTIVSELLPFIFLLFVYKRMKSKVKREYFIYSIITTIFVSLILFFGFVHPNPKIYFTSMWVNQVIELLLFVIIFTIILKNKIIKKLLALGCLLFFIFCCYEYFTAKNLDIPYRSLVIECLFFIPVIIYFFFEKMKEEGGTPLFNTFMFWFSVAFFINFVGNLLLFAYSAAAVQDANYETSYTIIYSSVTILKNLLLCFAVTIKEATISPNYRNTNDVFDMDDSFFAPDKTNP